MATNEGYNAITNLAIVAMISMSAVTLIPLFLIDDAVTLILTISRVVFRFFYVCVSLNTYLFHNHLQRDPPRSSKRTPLLENHHLYTAQNRNMLCFLLYMYFLKLCFSELANVVNLESLHNIEKTSDQNTISFTY